MIFTHSERRDGTHRKGKGGRRFLETSNRKEPGAEVLSRRKPAIHLPTITV